jgi:hypothetical protein
VRFGSCGTYDMSKSACCARLEWNHANPAQPVVGRPKSAGGVTVVAVPAPLEARAASGLGAAAEDENMGCCGATDSRTIMFTDAKKK